ncbi:MAG: DUF447 domain-containing protein [Pirellulaceae bacterium]
MSLTQPAADDLILEGIVTSLQADGTANISPMGPRVDRLVTRLVLRPFRTSQTYQNLQRHGAGVFHVTDDVELIARAAVGQLDPPRLLPAAAIRGYILADCCRWFAFRVRELDDAAERTTIVCEVVDRGTLRDFFGFNRAKHAVLEAAILATRIDIVSADEIRGEMRRLAIRIEKTAGDQERRAFAFLNQYLDQRLRQ